MTTLASPSRLSSRSKWACEIGDIRDLKGTLEREKAALGVFITLEPPSQDMETEAVSAGYYLSPAGIRSIDASRF